MSRDGRETGGGRRANSLRVAWLAAELCVKPGIDSGYASSVSFPQPEPNRGVFGTVYSLAVDSEGIMRSKRIVTAMAMAGAIVGTSIAVAPAAMADTASICGSSYHTVWGPKSVYTEIGIYAGSVYIGYNSSNGYNCAYLTVSSQTVASHGYRHSVTIMNTKTGDQSPPDDGAYNSFAGPVYVKAVDACVKAWGTVTYTRGDGLDGDGYYNTGAVACG
ncbi:hypothetical protein NE236_34280 [Actinoallomurus purpureus]|uniref:hypothetical protein n=1 Tax=Actinoallomurus purpureus TaxID=478114 RepID=UPI0020939C23|nr:hypothetical protein [Actinoallomurus purpureus]MCO6010049.1 hypothetical protein [Actinoallomurus purpureus]